MKLRNYQIKAVDAIFEAWQKFKSVLVVLPTGCGKTVVFASVIKRLMSEQPMMNADRLRDTQEEAFSDVATTDRNTDPTPQSKNALPASNGTTTATDSSCGVGATVDENSVRAVVAAPNRSQFACAEGTCVQKSPRVIVLAHREELVTLARD